MKGAADPVGCSFSFQSKQKPWPPAVSKPWPPDFCRLMASDDPARVGILPALRYEESEQREPKDLSPCHLQAWKSAGRNDMNQVLIATTRE
jgi:hypothetical protein